MRCCDNIDFRSITPYMKLHDMTPEEVVSQLRAEVEAKTDLTISAGIAPNKMLAKARHNGHDKR